MNHYTYILYNGHKYYVGVRSCKCSVEEDYNYLGSSKDKNFCKSIKTKTVLSYHTNRKDALLAEMYWQRLFDVVKNPIFANRAFQTSTGFDTTNMVITDSHRKNLSERKRNNTNAKKLEQKDLCKVHKLLNEGLTQKRISAILGVNQSTISRIKNKKRKYYARSTNAPTASRSN